MRRRYSPELGGGLSCVGEWWLGSEQTGEDAGASQTCSKAFQAIGALSWHSEATGEFLEVVRTWNDDRRGVL